MVDVDVDVDVILVLVVDDTVFFGGSKRMSTNVIRCSHPPLWQYK